MRRISTFLVVGLLTASACSSGGGADSIDGDAASPSVDVVAANDVAQLCTRWAEYEDLLESDAEPSDDLVAELLDRERGIEEVLPEDLDAAWRDITGWTAAFIEFFSVAGYQAVGEETVTAVFGGEQAAEDAADAMEDGFAVMNAWSALNCATGAGDAASFCRTWTDIAALLARLDEEPPTAERVDELFALYEETAADVPAEIQGDWNALLEFAIPFRDVLVTVEYDIDRVSDELLAEAFGSLDEFGSRERAADAGREAIDAWSSDGCGDFCYRWGETSEAIAMLGGDLHWIVDRGDEGRTQLDTMRARLDLASRQLPDELRVDWEVLMMVLDDWFGWWESFDFDGDRLFGSTEGHAAAADIAGNASYLAALVIETEGPPDADPDDVVAELASRADDHLMWTWEGAVGQAVSSTMERIDRWVDENCELERGLPGRIAVTWPAVEGAAGSTIVLSVLPPGATVEDLADVDARVAGHCSGVTSDPWGYELDSEGGRNQWASDWFRSEQPEDWEDVTLCDFDWEAGPAVLEPGPYTLLTAMVPGWVSDRTLPAPPTACAAIDIVVDGDTTVLLPELGPCDADLTDLVADDTWGSSDPVDPATPGSGTLRVTVPGLVLPEDMEGDGGELSIVVLPAGTTLNEVGREQVWPSGGYRTGLEPADNPWLVGLGAVAVPVVAMPANGEFGWQAFDPWWLSTAEDEELPLVVLAPGEYDVHVEMFAHHDGDWENRERLCGRTTVTIDGDTVIEMPELGTCP